MPDVRADTAQAAHPRAQPHAHPHGFTHTLTHSLTSRPEWRGVEHSALCDTTRVHAAVRSKKVCPDRVGFCGLFVRPRRTLRPQHEVAHLTSFSQDGGLWDSLEYRFVTEREGQITADTYLALSDLEATGMVVFGYHYRLSFSFFSPPGGRGGGGAGNPNCLALTAHSGPHSKSQPCVPRGD